MEVCFDYIYKYDAILKMVKLDSPATMTIKTTGDGASVLGLAILPIPGAGLGGLVLTILGGGSVVASKVFDDVESVPYGLFFVRSMKDHKMLEPTKVPCQSRWVE